MKRCLLLLLLLPITLFALPAPAQEVIFYRCTDAGGSVTLQNAPCPAGSTQTERRVATPTRAPAAPLAAPAAPVLGSSVVPTLQAGEEAPTLLDSDTLRHPAAPTPEAAAPKPPLPEIYYCTAKDGTRYLHEREPAPPRCELMSITGLGGSSAPGNAASCEVVRDTCTALPEELRCGAWQQRFRDARGRERFASPENQATAIAERERLEQVLAESACAVP